MSLGQVAAWLAIGQFDLAIANVSGGRLRLALMTPAARTATAPATSFFRDRLLR